MKVILCILAVGMLAAVFGQVDSVEVVDAVTPQQTIIIAEHVVYPVWRYTADSAVRKNDAITIRYLHRRQGGAVVADIKMTWRPRENAVNADSVKCFWKFNTTK